MRIWEIKGYVNTPGQGQVRFTTMMHALDRASATALAKAQYAGGDSQRVNISSIRDMGKSNLKQN
jgi:hypothetical protein